MVRIFNPAFLNWRTLSGTFREAWGRYTLRSFGCQLRIDGLIAVHNRRQSEMLLHSAPGGHSELAPYFGSGFYELPPRFGQRIRISRSDDDTGCAGRSVAEAHRS